ncbi:hypothetical protein EW145_g6695 [Phellinidium pouzarii]|uniref:Uncharacterized protein n=1 Tax=Phellinidium pouzarii TaxID=167371 RepID=A0A4S4KWM5_9AGAM|nr:hypothetical protein EW145_g6695 [Phellinidium pouzarii]
MAERKKPPSASRSPEDSLIRRAKRQRLAEPEGIKVLPPPSQLVGTNSPSTVENTNATVALSALLEFTAVSSHPDIHCRFDQIARALCHNHLLVVTTQLASAEPRRSEYEFLEIEFYLRKQDVHEDPFTHGSREQKSSGNWYFHRAPQKSANPAKSATSAAGYRGGTRKGLDLTIGGPIASAHFPQSARTDEDGPRGGVLFRSIRRVADDTVISGPSLLVDELLRVCGATSIAELINERLANDTSAFSSITSSLHRTCSITLVPRSPAQGRKPIVYSSPRIGLDLSHPGTTITPSDLRIIFIQKSYRYFLYPALLTANGRPQTFLGLYILLLEAEIINEEGVLGEVSKLSGLKRSSVDKYVSEYRRGKKSGKITSFVGLAGKGASSSPTTYLRMMGTLARLSA